MITCKLIKDGEEIPVVAINFAKQIVYSYDEPGPTEDLLYTTRYPLSQAKLKFIVMGEENEFSISEA